MRSFYYHPGFEGKVPDHINKNKFVVIHYSRIENLLRISSDLEQVKQLCTMARHFLYEFFELDDEIFYDSSDDSSSDEEAYGSWQELIRAQPVRVYSLLKCDACKRICHPPIMRSCGYRHLVCAFCSYEVYRDCEACHSPKQMKRAYSLEKLHSLLEFKCVFKKNGCDFRGLGPLMIDHINKCPCVVITCENKVCKWQGKPCELMNHYKYNHPGNYYKNQIVEIDFYRETEYVSNNFIRQVSENGFICINIALHPELNEISWIAYNLSYVHRIDEYKLVVKIAKKCGGTYDLDLHFTKLPNYREPWLNFEDIVCQREEMLNFEYSPLMNNLLKVEIVITPPS